MSRIEARIAANSTFIREICNEELIHFNWQVLNHELIKGSQSNLLPIPSLIYPRVENNELLFCWLTL